MRYRRRRHPQVVNSELIQHRKATDFLYTQMLFWESEGKKLVGAVYKLVSQASAVEASRLLREFSNVNDRAIDIAAKLAPYQSAKHSSIEVKSTNIKQFVIVAPKVVKNVDDWYKTINSDQKVLPKLTQTIKKFPEIEDIEYDQQEAS